MTYLLKPESGDVVDINTRQQKRFIKMLEDGRIDDAYEYLKWIKDRLYNPELAYPQCVFFEWKTDETTSVFELSTDEDFSDPVKMICKKNRCEVGNLYNGQKYYWRVNGCEPRMFETSDGKYRFMKVGGMYNIRDLGGHGIKQGLLYRGTELDIEYFITEDGIKTFLDELKIKSEIDVRWEHVGKFKHSVASENVAIAQFPFRPYTAIFDDRYKESARQFMEYLSDESNYPMYIHCMVGADRTAMVIFMIKAIAGESEKDMLIDYDLTSLSCVAPVKGFRRHDRNEIIRWLPKMAEYAPDKSLREQMIEYLRSCGVTDECMDKIRAIIKA
ncbi:MAG: tyrosine-protein phosphatase [Ruminococcaceae bacterium]|nr:tyrosine-protein phosphatase [Oscillospiraceae bacterium]